VGPREWLREWSKAPLPQLEPSVHGPCSRMEGEMRDKTQKTYSFEKYYDFLC